MIHDTNLSNQHAGSAEIFQRHQHRIHVKVDRMFAGLMFAQWLFAVAMALWISPRTWIGSSSQTHLHVWAALLIGGALTLYPVALTKLKPGSMFTRHVIAVSQLLMSGLLVHLSGGRIETHFHVFGSLAFLAFYRDWRVLVTGTLVTAVDHFVRGFLWSKSIYGVSVGEQWRWLEHAGWVIFEDVFLFIGCAWSLSELRGICERDAHLERNNADLEDRVAVRTAQLREVNSRLEALATTDPMTGLPNHRALVDLIDKEVERAHRYHRSCALLFIDLDHFKALNDTCGHSAGDIALKELGSIAQKCLRGIDTLGRWGGEEFVVLLPETDMSTAVEIAERFRKMVAAHSFPVGGGTYITCSVGVAGYPEDANDRSQLVEMADHAMYAAKKLGRNQVRIAADPIVTTLNAAEHESRADTALLGTVEALARMVEARDEYTNKQSVEVTRIATRIAEEMGLSGTELSVVAMVAKLHDIGKVAIPDAILKKPGRLTNEEMAITKLHTVIGADVAERVPSLRIAAAGIRSHHERWDGQGYPDQLTGPAIPLSARIVALADTYCAMLASKSYQEARSADDAVAEIVRCSGSQFDPEVVDAFLRAMDQTGGIEDAQQAA